MQTALDFLNTHRDVAFATCEGNLPRLRVFQIMKIENHRLYFATSPKKQVWQQKYAEYRATIPKGSTNYKHFYGWMFTEIYQGMRREAGKD